MSVLVSKSIVD